MRRRDEPESLSSIDSGRRDEEVETHDIASSQNESQISRSGMSDDFNKNFTLDDRDSQDLPEQLSGTVATLPSIAPTSTMPTMPTVVSALPTSSTTRTTRSMVASANSATSASVAPFGHDYSIPSATPILSWGTVCVVKRPSTHAKQKVVKPYALQNTFYAYPLDTEASVKSQIESKIQHVVENFEIQKYETEIVTFGLPFEVESIGCISDGHGNAPKKFTLPTFNKRKRNVSSSISDEEDSDEAGTEQMVEENTSRRRVVVKKKKI
jgi:hypothetical protein